MIGWVCSIAFLVVAAAWAGLDAMRTIANAALMAREAGTHRIRPVRLKVLTGWLQLAVALALAVIAGVGWGSLL